MLYLVDIGTTCLCVILQILNFVQNLKCNNNIILLFCQSNSPRRYIVLFFWTHLNLFYPRRLCAKFGWNGANGSGEDFIGRQSRYFHFVTITSPWKRSRPFISTEFNLFNPSVFLHVRLKLDHWFWRNTMSL